MKGLPVTPRAKTTTFRPSEHECQWIGTSTSNHLTPDEDVVTNSAVGSQELQISTSHDYRKLGSTRADIGSSFRVVRRELEELNTLRQHNRTVAVDSGSGDANPFAANYRGKYYAKFPAIGDSSFPPVVVPSTIELNALGTTAIARCIPTNSEFSASQFIGELREGLPSMVGVGSWKDRTSTLRQKAGGEELNYQFGLKPLVNDIKNFLNSAQRSEEIIRKYEKESGKLLHRRYKFPDTFTRTTSSLTGQGAWPMPAHQVGYWEGSGTLTTTTVVKESTWFSGAFAYYIPPWKPRGDNAERQRRIRNKLYDTRITPETLWNLAPWTWAADWFANTGDFIHNVVAFNYDGLVMPYGYIMRKRTVTTTYENAGWTTKRFHTKLPTLRQSLTTTVKQRRKATPYGFGLNFETFSDRQWAILVALGLARGRGKMNG